MIVRAVITAALFLSVQAAYAQQAGNDKIPIIDVHAHFIGRLSGDEFTRAAQSAVKIMDRFGIARSVILPPPQIDSHFRYDVARIAEATKAHQDRFIVIGGGARLNALIHRYADTKLITLAIRQEFALAAERIIDAGAKGFGEISGLHISARRRHPYEYVPADHPLLKLLADIAAKRDVPIDLHMDGLASPMKPPARFSKGNNPSILPATIPALERLLAHNRRARIVWAHGGSDPLGDMTSSTITRLMDSYPNLFVSLRIVGARAPMFNKLFHLQAITPAWLALFKRHSGRFVIGSDSFYMPEGRTGSGPGFFFARRTVPKLRATRRALSLLPKDIARKIAFENAIHIYRLKAPH